MACKEKTYTFEEWKQVFNEITNNGEKTEYELIWRWVVDFRIDENVTINNVETEYALIAYLKNALRIV